MSLRFEKKKLQLGDTSGNLMPKVRNNVGIGIGTCTRDNQGHFIPARMEWFSAALDVDLCETIEFFLALKWVRKLQWLM